MKSKEVIEECSNQIVGTSGNGVNIIKHPGGTRMTVEATADSMIMIGRETVDVEELLVDMAFDPESLRNAADRIDNNE